MISWRFFGPGGSIRQLHQKLKITPLWGIFYDRWQRNIPHVENK